PHEPEIARRCCPSGTGRSGRAPRHPAASPPSRPRGNGRGQPWRSVHGACRHARDEAATENPCPATTAGTLVDPSVGVLHVGLVQFEPETPVHRDGGGVVTLDIEDDLTQPPCDEITQSRDGQGLAHTS